MLRLAGPVIPKKAVQGLKYFSAGHPVPDEESWKAAEAILAVLRKCDKKTLAFFLLSGGGSAVYDIVTNTTNITVKVN